MEQGLTWFSPSYDHAISAALGLAFPLHLRLIEHSLNKFGAPTTAYSIACHALICATIALHRRSSTWSYCFLWVHVLGSALILARTAPHLAIRPWIQLPMFTSAATLVACHILPANTPSEMSATFPSLYLSLHGVRIGFGLVRAMIFPARIIAKCYDLPPVRQQMMKSGWKNLRIEGPYGSSLDAYAYRPMLLVPPTPPTKKWLVWFGGNGEIAEGSWETAQAYANQLSINALVFNYRGIGESTGRAASADDLIADGYAVLTHLMRNENVEPKDFVLFGHSLGGGVALCLGDLYTKGRAVIINDRSFSSLYDAVCAIGENIAPLSPSVFRVLLNTVFGDMNSLAHWRNIPEDRKVLVFHRRDNVLPYQRTALHRVLVEAKDMPQPLNVVELTEVGSHLDPHNSATMQFEGHKKLIAILQRISAWGEGRQAKN